MLRDVDMGGASMRGRMLHMGGVMLVDMGGPA